MLIVLLVVHSAWCVESLLSFFLPPASTPILCVCLWEAVDQVNVLVCLIYRFGVFLKMLSFTCFRSLLFVFLLFLRSAWFLISKLIHVPNIFVMGWSGVVEGQDTGSRVSQKARPQQAYGKQVLLYSSRQFSTHPESSLARIDKRAVWDARNTCYHSNQIGPLDHKIADNCVFLARTNSFFYNN